MFIGAINTDLRSVLAEMAPAWKGLPVYVGCSGNATIERILSHAGLTDLRGNDVSLYSCALGFHLAGKPFSVRVRDERLAWLRDYLKPGLPTVATLLVCTTALEFFDRNHPYHDRMWGAYTRRWPALVEATEKKLTAGVAGVTLADFYAGDVVDFLSDAPDESVVISFPPTYKGGYERLYRRLQATFEWDEPAYELFRPERFEALCESMRKKKVWVVSRDEPIESLGGFEVALVQTGMRTKPVWVYSNQRLSRITLPRQGLDPVPYRRIDAGPINLPLELIRLTQRQLNTLRSEYLSPSIAPATVDQCFGVLAGGRLAGAFGIVSTIFGWCDLYMMTDLAVSSSVPRLSKLVLAAVLSVETKALLEQRYAIRVNTIGTTAFTDKPISMKYRGLWELQSRKEGRLNYLGKAGRWTLQEGMEWWLRTQQKPSLAD